MLKKAASESFARMKSGLNAEKKGSKSLNPRMKSGLNAEKKGSKSLNLATTLRPSRKDFTFAIFRNWN